MATDGLRTLAFFNYEDTGPFSSANLNNQHQLQIGFSKGDGTQFVNLTPTNLQNVNLFRIDGIFE